MLDAVVDSWGMMERVAVEKLTDRVVVNGFVEVAERTSRPHERM